MNNEYGHNRYRGNRRQNNHHNYNERLNFPKPPFPISSIPPPNPNEIGVLLRQTQPRTEPFDLQNLNLDSNHRNQRNEYDKRNHRPFDRNGYNEKGYHQHNNRGGYQNYRQRKDNSISDKRPTNITASGIPLSNTLDDSGTSISYLPGTASLIEDVDTKQMVVLRDGKILIGMLRSVDQFGNLALQDTIQRTVIDNRFHDEPQGIFLVRGENVALMGQVDDSKEQEILDNKNRMLQQMPREHMEIKNAELLKKLADSDKEKNRSLRDRGMYAYKEMPGDQYV